ncbi:MAG: hypothetical protein CL670_01740 [Balneola sp.]|jgi:hypothetical protein|nr:hypothetical protein [Balneola sp.]MBE77857.1 hypothetical protein [Balneola sp.]|tara:strand:- start:952 stop:1716 length:765 start_codon:yes stop_codon:yes gene_type:complete
MADSIWKTYKLNSEEDLHITVGELHVWISKQDEEIWIAHQYSDKVYEEKPEDLEWARWAPKSIEEIRIAPVFQDLPVIINSEYPLKVAKGSTIQIFSRIPVWLQISLAKSKYVLTEIPSIKLSRTWFGSPQEGELCYWLSTKARRSLAGVENKPNVINCPIQISNKTHEDLDFEKFCFRVERLSVYGVKEELWADETKIEYNGEEQHSDINMTGKLPVAIGKGELMSKPRNPASKSFATRTFKMFFDDTFISAR